MSLLGKDKFFTGSFSMAGRDSAEKYNITAEAKKVEEKEKNRVFKSFFSPDTEWEEKQEPNNNENIARECNLNIDEIKKNYKYSLEYIKKKNNDSQNVEKSSNLNIQPIKNEKNESKKQNKIFRKIFQSFKYKYHNIHLSKIEKYKQSGLIHKMNVL